MNRTRWIFLALLLAGAPAARAQTFEVQQLVLDIEKLAKLKDILKDLKEGYQVLDKGYSAIRDVSKGSFDLHKAFLDALLTVSPPVRNYVRVTEILRMETAMLSKYRTAWARVQGDRHFRPDEVAMIGSEYGNLIDQSAKGLDDLVTVLTDGQLRASDAERLAEIDRIYGGMRERTSAMDGLDRSTAVLSLQRAADAADYETVRKLYGITP